MRTRAVLIVALLGLAACSAEEPGRATPAPAATPAATTTAATTPAPTSARATTPPAPPTVTLAFTGDMLVHDDLRVQAARNAGGTGFDFTPMLAEVAPILRAADWAVCHQETPISADNSALSGYPAFNAPRELAAAMKAAG